MKTLMTFVQRERRRTGISWNSFLTGTTVALAFGVIPARAQQIPDAMRDCGQQYAAIRDEGLNIAEGLKAFGSLCPAPSEAASARNPGPSEWYLASNDGSCTPAHKMTPAWVVQYDKARGITDQVMPKARSADGTLISVETITPTGNGMVAVYHFFRGIEACQAYVKQKLDALKELQ